MKKITLLILFIVTCVFNAHAQFPESFETTVPPSGWVSFRGTNGVGTESDWVPTTVDAATGEQSAFVEYEDIDPDAIAEDWLVTPQFTPSAAANILSFLESQSFTTDYGTEYTIRVSTASQTTHADFTIVDTQAETDFGRTFSPHFVDLSAYNGIPIYVAFVMAQDDGDDWYIDDVDLVPNAAAPSCASNPIPADLAPNVFIPNGNLTLSWEASATGDAPIGYEFFFGDTSGALDSFGYTSATSIDLIYLDYATTYYWIVVSYNAGGSATGCAEWSFTTQDAPPPPVNDACSGAFEVTSLPYNFSQTDGYAATNNDGFINSCIDTAGFGMNDGVWYTFTPTTDGAVDIVMSNVDADFDPQMDLYSGSCGVLICVNNSDVELEGVGESIIGQAVSAGTQYFVNVGDYSRTVDNPEGNFDIHITGTITLSINDFTNTNSFSYFPNPVENKLSLKAQSNIQNVSIYNMLGQEVLRTAPNTLASDINMNPLQSGAYFVKVTINDATETIRVIKQ